MTAPSEVLPSDDIASIAADSGGRVWLGTTYGLAVFDGANWQTFLMSNSDLVDNDVKFVLATNDGPASPARPHRKSQRIADRQTGDRRWNATGKYRGGDLCRDIGNYLFRGYALFRPAFLSLHPNGREWNVPHRKRPARILCYRKQDRR